MQSDNTGANGGGVEDSTLDRKMSEKHRHHRFEHNFTVTPKVHTFTQFMVYFVSQQFFQGALATKEIHVGTINKVVKSNQVSKYFLA